MASRVDKFLSIFENSVCLGKNPFSFDWKESGASRLIITVRKAWLLRVRSGVSLLRPPQEKGVKIKLTIFRGQSFNYFFYAAGATYQHLADIKTILDRKSKHWFGFKDEVYNSLFENTNDAISKTYTQKAAELAIGVMLLILERQAKY